MMLEFRTCDVCTGRRFAGNPLAIVLGAGDLTPTQMQTLAGVQSVQGDLCPGPGEGVGEGVGGALKEARIAGSAVPVSQDRVTVPARGVIARFPMDLNPRAA